MRLIIAAATWFYGRVLALYPRPFRALFATEMQDTFRLLLIDAAKQGLFPFLWVLIRETLGAIGSAVSERLREPSFLAAGTLRRHGWLFGVVLVILALIVKGAVIPEVVFYVVLPLVIVVLLLFTRTAPILQRPLGIIALVASWPLLAFWVALVVEGWNNGVNGARVGDPVSPLAQVYDSILNHGLQDIEYGYVIMAVSASICVVRLARAPGATHAPFVFALSNLAVAVLFFVSSVALPLVRPIDVAAPRNLLLKHAHQDQLLLVTLGVALIMGLLCFQTWWRIDEPHRRNDRTPSRRQYYLWSSVSAIVLLVAPFTPWVISPFPADPPGSLVYLIGTFWEDTLEHMFVKDILNDTLFSLGVGSMWLYAGATLLRLASRRQYHAARLCGLAGSTCFMSWIMPLGAMEYVAWGYWLCCFALLACWTIETRWTLRTSPTVLQIRQRLMPVR